MGMSIIEPRRSRRARRAGTRPARGRPRLGIYLPGITFDKGYRLKLRIIHEADQFNPRHRAEGILDELAQRFPA
jgi:hypothetical protein